jgi:hypothetical protein
MRGPQLLARLEEALGQRAYIEPIVALETGILQSEVEIETVHVSYHALHG